MAVLQQMQFDLTKRLTGADTTEDPATNRLSHYCGGYDMFKVKNWKLEMWLTLAMNHQEDTGRTQPIMYMDMAWDRDSINKTNDFNYGF